MPVFCPENDVLLHIFKCTSDKILSRKQTLDLGLFCSPLGYLRTLADELADDKCRDLQE